MRHKILLLGLGFWGEFWLNAIKKSDRCELVGVAIGDMGVENVSIKYDIPQNIIYKDYKEAIQNSNATIAIIVIPAKLHFNAAKLSLENGMNVIMEKPLAMDLDEAKKLIEVKSKYPLQKFMTSQNYRWRPHNQAIKNIIKENKIGKIQDILVEFRKPEDLQGYRNSLEQPLLQDVCIHHFDLIRFFTESNCKQIYCTSYRPIWSEFNGKPSTNAIMELENDIHVTYNGSWAARGKETSWDGNFVITGEKGCITLNSSDEVHLYEYNKNNENVLGTITENGIKIDKPEMAYTEIDYGFNMFMDSIENNKTPETTLEDNINSFAIVSAAQESVKSGKVERL